MSLRALGSLLTRRFSPRAQAQVLGTHGSAAGRPARFLRSLRILAVGGAGVATAGGLTFMYLKKDTDESAGKAIGEKAMKEVTDKKPGNAGKIIIISDEACDGKAGHEATGSEPEQRRRLRGVSPPDEEYYEFLKSRAEVINYHKGLAGKA